ncbi:N-acetylglucosamine-1-phosphotransferase subunits alpha/beta, partial [Elysia marginata]
MEERLKKILQKRFYDLLSHKNGILMMMAGTFLLTISAFHFGEALLEWSQDKYEAMFHSFSDNVAQKNFRDRLSTALPIDVVYTWVNGSDPELLRQLEMIKVSPSNKINSTSEIRCPYTNCVCVGLLLSPPLPAAVTLDELKLIKFSIEGVEGRLLFSNVTHLKEIRQQSDWPGNFTQLDLPTEHDATQILSVTGSHWSYNGVNYTVNKAFYTSDMSLRHGINAPSVVMMSGYPSRYAENDIKMSLSSRVNDTIKFPIEDTGLAIDGKTVMFNQVKLVWSLQQDVKDDVIAASRFEDNEELRYSLRSIEKYAPWVRHIFIVTNGQIPYWLNLDSPRLTVVTHDEIFQNKSHLPSFSSPAIEAHIHQIPGLSDRFIYMNDDVMFGRPVWPEDFYTHSSGQKVRICKSNSGAVQYGVGFHGQAAADTTSYCATGCADTWLSDKYCDQTVQLLDHGELFFQACNNLECGFDTGDCGTNDFHQLHGFDLRIGKTHYRAPPGEHLMYFNLTELLGDEGKVSSARAKANKAVRVASVTNKFKVMSLILHPGHNATTVTLSLEYNKGANTSFSFEKDLEEPVANEYIVEGWQGRQLLDTFGDSLRHVNSLYNKEFGFAARKVPAHMPHFIDKNIMNELQDRFPQQWEDTSSHQIRNSADMQYSFSYFYYLMGVTEEVPVGTVFEDMDTDMSGVLSDREIRTLATRLYDLPLYLE